MNKIIFTDISDSIHEMYHPIPAKKAMPRWLKSLQPYDGGKFEVYGGDGSGLKANSTAKKCLPMLDAAMSGYIIPLPHDIHIDVDILGDPYFKWPNGMGIEFHPPFQASTHPGVHGKSSIPKLMTPWSIETPKGYSSLMIPPLNSEDLKIIPFSGVVDTDTYINAMNFPFLVKEGFSGMIPAGTPFVQVIPFKRNSWKMEVSSGITSRIKKSEQLATSTFRNIYREAMWARKDYS